MSVVSSFQLPANCICARLSEQRSHQLVGVGCSDNQARIMRFGDGRDLCTFKGHGNPITALAFDHGQQMLATGSERGGIRQWDITQGDTVRVFEGHRSAVTGIDWCQPGNFVASASKDTNLRIWDIRKKDCLQSYKDAPGPLTSCKFSPNGRWIATACEDGGIRLYDLVAGKNLKDFLQHRSPITFLAFHPTEFFLAASSMDGTISMWDVEKHKLLYQSNKGFMKNPYSAVTFGNQQLIAANKEILRVYDFDKLGDRHAKNIETSWDFICDLQYAPGSNEILSVETRGDTLSMVRMPLSTGIRSSGAAPAAKAAYPPVSEPSHKEEYKQQRVVRQPPSPRSEQRIKKPAEAFDVSVHDRKKKMDQMQRARQDDAHVAEMLPEYESQSTTAPTEMEYIEQVFKQHNTLSVRLERRTSHLKTGRSGGQNLKSALNHLVRVAQDNIDAGAVLDFINAMQHQRMKERCDVEHLPGVLELIAYVITTQKTERALTIAMKTTRSMNTKFGDRIEKEVRAARYGVDLAMDGRCDRARMAQQGFEDIYMLIAPYATRSDSVGDEAKALISELPTPSRL